MTGSTRGTHIYLNICGSTACRTQTHMCITCYGCDDTFHCTDLLRVLRRTSWRGPRVAVTRLPPSPLCERGLGCATTCSRYIAASPVSTRIPYIEDRSVLIAFGAEVHLLVQLCAWMIKGSAPWPVLRLSHYSSAVTRRMDGSFVSLFQLAHRVALQFVSLARYATGPDEGCLPLAVPYRSSGGLTQRRFAREATHLTLRQNDHRHVPKTNWGAHRESSRV